MSLTLFGYTIDPVDPRVAVLLLALVFLALPYAGWRVTRRASRNLAPVTSDASAGSSPAADERVASFLRDLDRALELPGGLAAEVAEEVAGHIADAIAELEAEGLDREHATREAIARLGSPKALGDSIRRAHQTTRRAVAAVGAGAIALGGEFVLSGFKTAIVLVIPLLIAGLLAGIVGGNRLPGDNGDGLILLMTMLSFAGAAYYGARAGIDAVAGISQRRPERVAPVVAAVTSMAMLAFGLFVPSGTQSPLTVGAALVMPVAALAAIPAGRLGRLGGLARRVGPRRTVAVALGAACVAFVCSMLVYPSFVPGPPDTRPNEAELAPLPPLASGFVRDAGAGHWSIGISETGTATARDDQAFPALNTWSGVRLEIWRGSATARGGRIDPRYASPAVAGAALRDGNALVATVPIGPRLDAESWWIVPTAAAPDGHRYRLQDAWQFEWPFHGTVWDWLTAPR